MINLQVIRFTDHVIYYHSNNCPLPPFFPNFFFFQISFLFISPDQPSHLSRALIPPYNLSGIFCYLTTMSNFKNVILLPQTNQLIGLYSIIRDKTTKRGDFVFYSDRIIRLLVEEGLNQLPVEEAIINCHGDQKYTGARFLGKICGVSIVRAGESMEMGLRDCCRSVKIGKILIQRDEETALPKLFYEKLPEDISERYVFLLDPMLATGGSAMMAVEVLLSRGVKADRILFLNLLAAPEGIAAFHEKFPDVKIITGGIDEKLDDDKYIVPGLGDFGDRYYCI